VLALLELEHNHQDWLLLSYLTMLVVVLVGLFALYRWGPSRARARWRWIVPGAVLALIALVLTSTAFSWYVATFGGNNLAYGSLGAIIAFMSWMWFSVIIVIMGAEINSEIEHQTLRDSTTGAERPFGERNAYMADTIGEVWPPAQPREPGEPHPFAPRHFFRGKKR
jgi:membrane protein